MKERQKTKNRTSRDASTESESKVVFCEGTELRVIRGVVIEEDACFLTLQRRDGRIKIAKTAIIKICQPKMQAHQRE